MKLNGMKGWSRLTFLVFIILSSDVADSESAAVETAPEVVATSTASTTEVASASEAAQGSTSSGIAIPPALAVELDQLLPDAENGTTSQMTALMGETVLLPCKAYSLGQRTVSWMRRLDWHILSSGSRIYTGDSRFHVLHRPGSPDWILMLKSPQLIDSGVYECQISGDRGRVSHYVELLVWAPVATISEGNEHHVEAGSNIKLHCSLWQEQPTNMSFNFSVNEANTPFKYPLLNVVDRSSSPVIWFHNGRPLSDGTKSTGGGLVMVHIEGDKSKWTTWTSRLLVSSANSLDSGNYSCVPWRGKTGSVSVFVFQGDRPAAVQRQSANRSSIPALALVFGLLLLQNLPFLVR